MSTRPTKAFGVAAHVGSMLSFHGQDDKDVAGRIYLHLAWNADHFALPFLKIKDVSSFKKKNDAWTTALFFAFHPAAGSQKPTTVVLAGAAASGGPYRATDRCETNTDGSSRFAAVALGQFAACAVVRKRPDTAHVKKKFVSFVYGPPWASSFCFRPMDGFLTQTIPNYRQLGNNPDRASQKFAFPSTVLHGAGSSVQMKIQVKKLVFIQIKFRVYQHVSNVSNDEIFKIKLHLTTFK